MNHTAAILTFCSFFVACFLLISLVPNSHDYATAIVKVDKDAVLINVEF